MNAASRAAMTAMPSIAFVPTLPTRAAPVGPELRIRSSAVDFRRMTDAELMFRPVTDLAGLVRRGEVSARELVETSVRRTGGPRGRAPAAAVVDGDGDRAIAAADDIGTGDPRPFAGVPIAIKNNRAVTGWRLTHACDLMQDFVADFDHHAVRRFKEAGVTGVGTSNLPEYGILPSTEPRQKSTRNPWDPERKPGGSSGGSGAAVAS